MHLPPRDKNKIWIFLEINSSIKIQHDWTLFLERHQVQFIYRGGFLNIRISGKKGREGEEGGT